MATEKGASNVAYLQKYIVEFTLVAMLLMFFVLGFFERGKIRRNESYRARSRWFWPPEVIPFSSNWIIILSVSGFWTTLLMSTSVAILHWFERVLPGANNVQSDMRELAFDFPGVFFVFGSAFLGMASVVNTFCLLQKNVSPVRSFRELAQHIREIQRADAGAALPVQAPVEQCYVVDYVPAIGWLSDRIAYSEIAEELKKLPRRFDRVYHFIFLAPTDYTSSSDLAPRLLRSAACECEPSEKVGARERVVETMVLRAGYEEASHALADYRELIKVSEELCDRLDSEHGAVWFTSKISFEHYLVDKCHAIDYCVTPSHGTVQQRNTVRGTVHYDAQYVDYLGEICRTYLRQSITPEVSLVGNSGELLSLTFAVGQPRIERIELDFFDRRKGFFAPYVDPVETVQIEVKADLQVDKAYLVKVPSNACWVAVRLVKMIRHGDEFRTGAGLPIVSPSSFFVRLPLRSVLCNPQAVALLS